MPAPSDGNTEDQIRYRPSGNNISREDGTFAVDNGQDGDRFAYLLVDGEVAKGITSEEWLGLIQSSVDLEPIILDHTARGLLSFEIKRGDVGSESDLKKGLLEYQNDVLNQLNDHIEYAFDQLGDIDFLRNAKRIERKLANQVKILHNACVDIYRYFIEEQEQRKVTAPGLLARLEKLERFAREHNGVGVALYAEKLFPELAAPKVSSSKAPQDSRSLPNEPPELYQGLRGPETPPDFVKRVYGEWLGQGLTRAHIRKLDPKLYTAIDNWLKKPGCEWPRDVDLPTLKEQNDRDVARLNSGDGQEILGKFTGKEAARLGAAISRRSK